ncbi:Talin-2 [Geodia barretti]|nr:Talin-2 [Geodia barretti]
MSKDPDSSPPISPGVRRKRPMSGTFSNASKRWTNSRVRKQISKKHQIRLDTPWLDPNKTLAEQEVTDSDELILMYRYYYHMSLDRHSPNLELLYKQARATYLAGEMLCSVGDMVRLSAILTQINKGDYVSEKHNSEVLLQIKGQIAPPKCKVKHLSKQILAEHAALKGLTVRDAMCWFVKLWSSLQLFGMEFLSCTNIETKENGLIGVSKDRVVFLPHKKKKNFCWDMATLVDWKQDGSKDVVTLSFNMESSTHTLTLSLHLPEYSGVLADCLQGHRELSDTVVDMSSGFHEFQFDEELETAISGFTDEGRKDPKDKAFTNLTYEDVYWASKIANPLFSGEELHELKEGAWENPAYDNMDQLMDERFSFLDFTEYTSSETASMDSGIISGRSLELPLGSPVRRKSEGLVGGQSPLVRSTHSMMACSPVEPWKPLSSSALHLSNGLLDNAHLKTHSRTASSGSSIISDGLPSPRPTDSSLLPAITTIQHS